MPEDALEDVPEFTEELQPELQQTVPERPRGRPKKGSVPPEAVNEKPFPAPPKSLSKDSTIPAAKFWDYRRNLPAKFIPRLIFYVYRQWPVMDLLRPFSEEERKKITSGKVKGPMKYAAKYADINPDSWEGELLPPLGSGTYKILMNDGGVRGNPSLKSCSICQTVVELRDDAYPPVLDLALVDLSDPANQSYLQKQRENGIVIPGDIKPLQENENDMANNPEVMGKLLDAALEKKAPPAQDMTAVINLIQENARAQQEQLKQQMDAAEKRHARDLAAMEQRLKEAQDASKTKQSDPVDGLKALVEAAKLMAPPPPADNGMVGVLTEMLRSSDARHIEEMKLAEARHARSEEAMAKRLESTEARLTTMAAPQPAPAAAAHSNGIKDVLDVLKAVGDLREGLDGVGGGSSVSDGPVWLAPLMENVPKLLDTASNIAQSFAAARNAPPPPADFNQQPQQQQPRSTGPQVEVSTNPIIAGKQAYARGIKDHMLNALAENLTGSQFAAYMIREQGNDAGYRRVLQLGHDGIIDLLQSAQDVWQPLMAQGPPKVDKFLREILDVEAVKRELDAMQGAAPMQPQQHTNGVAVEPEIIQPGAAPRQQRGPRVRTPGVV